MDVGRVALKRGPLVYCVEEVDNPGGRVQRLDLPRDARIGTERAGRPVRRHRHPDRATLLASMTTDGTRQLYRPNRRPSRRARLTALPYYLWNNRCRGSMTVWLSEVETARPASG